MIQKRLTLLERLEQRPIKTRREDQDLILRTLTEAELDLLVRFFYLFLIWFLPFFGRFVPLQWRSTLLHGRHENPEQ